MLFSYAQAREADLPLRAAQFVAATQVLTTPTGMILSPQAHREFMVQYGVDKEVQDLIAAITDEESVRRVDAEIKRRIVTSKIPEELASAITEAIEVLGLQRTDLSIAEIPLVVVMYADISVRSEPVVINVSGTKALADALRLIWSKAYMSPHPHSIPSVATAIMRMPPVIATARARRSDTHVVIEAVEGWGRFVGTDETADEYVLSTQTMEITQKDVRAQESMIARNERSQQIVKTTPFNASGQKITDDQMRSIVADMKRMNLTDAVFGFSNQKRWLLMVPEAKSIPKIHEAQFEPEAEVEVVDLDITATTEEAPSQEDHVQEEPSYEPPQEPIIDTTDEAPAEKSPHITSSEQAARHTQEVAQQLLESCFHTIELAMREWLYEKDQPEDFGELVSLVSNKRQIPYKNRVLSLWEIKRSNGFADADAESVRFGLDTMHKFLREFS